MLDSRVSPAQPIVRGEGSVLALARVRCEILPVACADGQIVALTQRCGAAEPVPGWWRELPAGQHPTELVVKALISELGPVFDQSKSVVHSTSWRYEEDQLVLSYLAALPPLTGDPSGFVLQPVDTGSAGAGRTSDPHAIPVMDVLTHGLRHLAMLRISNPTIADTLSECWHKLLATWNPLPAGLLEHCVLHPAEPVTGPTAPGPAGTSP